MIRTPAGHTVCSDVGITSAFAHHYARLGEPSPVDTADFDAEHMRYVQAQVAQYTVRSHDPSNADSALDAVPSRDEIAGVVEKLRNHKAGTEEGIVNEMLKYGGPAILDMLAGLVETLWSTELVPGHWRAGDIVNIFKKGDKKDPGNYKGITLLNMVGKLYTKVIDSRLSAWLHTHHRLHVCQAGFRSQRSCIDHVFSLSHIVQERTRQGLPTWLFFRDAAKAFDTVWRDGMLDRLWDIGVRGRMWRIVRNLYQGNRSRVVVNGQKSDFFPIDQGVAQGIHCHPHCMPSLRMHCCRSCMQGTTWKAPLQGESLHCCTLMISLALHSQQMAYRVTLLILVLSMHVGIGTGQMCPSVVSWSVVLLLLCRPCPQGPSLGDKRRFPECTRISTWESSQHLTGGRTRTSNKSSPREMRACCRWGSYFATSTFPCASGVCSS